MITVSTLWHRWWRAFAVALVVLVAVLAGNAFRTGEQVSTLIVDLRAPYDQHTVDQETSPYRDFPGNVIFVVSEGAEQLCTSREVRGGGARPTGLIVITTYCPLPKPPHTTVVLSGAPAKGGLADMAGHFSVSILRFGDRVHEAGRPEGSFVWPAALLTGGTLIAIALGLPRLVAPRKRRGMPLITDVPWQSPLAQLGGSVTEYGETARYSSGAPQRGGDADPMAGPQPPSETPHQPAEDPPAVGDAAPAPAPWAPLTPTQVVLTPAGSPTFPELAWIVREAGDRAVARTHIDAPGGYVAIGDVVVWGASSTSGVLPGEPVAVAYTGDPGAPLTISPAHSRPVPEQGYHR